MWPSLLTGCVCNSHAQSHHCLHKLAPPEDLQPNMPAFKQGQAVFLWVPERQRLIGVLAIAAAAELDTPAQASN